MPIDPLAAKGYVVLSAGDSDLETRPISGISVLEDLVISGITHPSNQDGTKYNGEPAKLIGKTLLAGSFYPIPATAIDIGSGVALGWIA